MSFVSFFFIVFGILIIAMPEIIAYLIGAFMIFIGISTFLTAYMLRQVSKTHEEKIFSFGGYEFVKKNK